MTERSDSRQRPITLTARFNEQEAEAVRQLADSAGVPVASFMRAAALNRSLRRPPGGKKDAARILGQLGRIADELRSLQANGNVAPDHPHLIAAWRDLAEMRFVCLQYLGVEP